MKYEISPGIDGEPTLYADNYPIAEVYYVEKVEHLLSIIDIAEKALIDSRDFLRLEEKWEAANFIDEALKQIRA